MWVSTAQEFPIQLYMLERDSPITWCGKGGPKRISTPGCWPKFHLDISTNTGQEVALFETTSESHENRRCWE